MAYSSKKLGGSGSGFAGTSIYNGVFSGSAPFRPSSAASRPEDYAEIFGGPRDARRSSIPVLDVPALRDRNVSVDVRSSKLDYSNIFGGGSDDAAPSYEDVFTGPRKIKNMSRQEQNEAHTRSSSGVSFGGSENHLMCSKASHPSPDKVKKQVNMSFQKNVGGVKDRLNGMTHVAKFRDVPGYACLVDESDPSKLPKAADRPVNNGAGDQSEKARDMKMPEAVLSSSSLDKQYSKDIHQNRSRSNSSLFEAYEFDRRAEPSEVQASTDFVHNISSMQGNFSPGKVSEGGISIGSPTYFDGEVDASSVAAASADAVRKAIEQAQARIKVAKEIMGRQKEACQGDGDSKSFREPRRVRRKASVFKEKDPPEQKIPAKTGSESKYIHDHDIQSNNFSRHRNERFSTDTVEYNLPEKAAEKDARMLTMNIESEEIKIKPLENKQGSEKTIPLTNHCEMPMTRMTIESVAEVSVLSTEVEAAPLLDICDKTECGPSTAERAQNTENHSNKSESGGPLQFVEIDEKGLEDKGEKHENIEQHTGYSNDKEYHANTDGFNGSSSDINLDDHRVDEKIVRTEYISTEENKEKVSERHEVDSIRPKDIPSGKEETGSTACMTFDKIEEKEGEGECYAKECDQEQNNKQSENCEAEAEIGLRNISDGVAESTSFGTVEGKEESSEPPSESRETNGEQKTEATDYLQESKKEHSGFNLGADARQWLDNMKEMLNVRINSFLDAKENNRPQEDADVEDNCQLEAEVSDEKIVEETGEAEAKGEVHGAPETMIDEKTTIEVNSGREVAGENTADEGKDDGCEYIDGIMESLDEDKESVVMDSTNYEDVRDEVIAHVTNPSVEERELPEVINLSVDETESQDIDGINLDKSEPTNLSDDRGESLHNNVEKEEVCASETSDLTRSSDETEGEKQVQATVEEGLNFPKGDLNLGFTGIKFGFWHSNQHAEGPEEICEMGKHVDESGPQVDECLGNENASESSTKEEEVEEKGNETELKAEVAEDYKGSDNEKTAYVSSNDEEESEELTDEMDVKSKTSDDQRWEDNEATMEENQLHFVLEREERTMDDIQETTTSQVTEKEETEPTAQVPNENEFEDYSQGVEMEKPIPKKRDARKRWEKDNERDREMERLAVERAIREARERAFADARERAERAAVEKATAEARQRVMAQAREKMGKSSSETSSKPAEKTSAEVRLRAERAAVERATAEARERALERAWLEKLSGAGKDNKVRPKPSYDSQHKRSAPSSNNRNSNSFNTGAPRPTEKSNGANAVSAQWSKARLERHQRTAERAAKALAEKNMRDLIAQREQAERNRLAEALDADVKRWSNGKQGNLRALLSTLQYILGPESGWQPVTLTEIVTSAAMKKAYRKATLCVHPDKLQQRGASLQQKYICEKVFDLLKEAWNRSSAEEK